MARVVAAADSGLTLTADGNWLHEGELATHPGVSRYFHQCLRKDGEGAFFLYNKVGRGEAGTALVEHVYVTVEDTAYFVWQLHYRDAEERFEVELNTGARVDLDLDGLTLDEAGNVYCQVLDGDEARFGRHAMTQLAPFLDTEGEAIVLLAGTRRVPFLPRR